MKTRFVAIGIAVSTSFVAHLGFALDLPKSLDLVARSVEAANYPKALKELEWVRAELEKSHRSSLEKFFPPALGDFYAVEEEDGMSIKSINEMSVTKVTSSAYRTYLREKGQEVVLSIASPIGQQANLPDTKCNQAILSHLPGTEVLRVGERLASIQTQDILGKRYILTVCLKQGTVALETSDEKIKGELTKLAGSIKYDEIERYMNGFE